MHTALAASVLLLPAASGFAQSGSPAFEVASVRISPPGKRAGGFRPVQVEPGSLTMRGISLTGALAWAYGVQDFQVAGPAWMNEGRYDIAAKAAGGASDEGMQPMLRTLLADRLKVAAHREEKVMQYYILTVAKGGPKIKETTEEGDPDIAPAPNRTSVAAHRMTVARFCELLGLILHAPIQDQTGLTGRYDANLDFSQLVAAYPQGPPADEVPAMVMNGIQDMLGLKLEAKKGPVEMIVVDRAEKVPTEN